MCQDFQNGPRAAKQAPRNTILTKITKEEDLSLIPLPWALYPLPWPRKISQNLSFIFEYSRVLLQLQVYHINMVLTKCLHKEIKEQFPRQNIGQCYHYHYYYWPGLFSRSCLSLVSWRHIFPPSWSSKGEKSP